ncbi:MAG: hypothetical protein JXI32_08605 [Deltaproteobacteria bacterium]|nr:hypothetical protein [Deltaproteobacteria bacterium]
MSKSFLIFFILLGAGDFLYGIFSSDRISIFIGAVIIVLATYVARRKKSDDDTAGPSPE